MNNPMNQLSEFEAEYDRLDGWNRRWLKLANDTKRMAARWPLQVQMERVQMRAQKAGNAKARLLEKLWEMQRRSAPSPALPQPYQSELDEAAGRMTLPLDATEEQLQATVRSLRQYFETRTEYNFMVADMLASRGIPPNGANVLATGGWGNSSSAAADIKLWYAGLAARLSAGHAAIPDAVRRNANSLIEQLWALANSSTREPLIKISEELTGVKASLASRELESAQGLERENELASKLETQSAQSQVQIASLKEQIATRQTEIDGLHDQVSELRSSIASTALLHRQAVRDLQDQAQAELAKQLARQQQEHRQAENALQAKLDAAIALVNEKAAQIEHIQRQQALALDQYRQDAREAGARADKAHQTTERVRAQLDAAKEQLTSAEINAAKLEQQLFATTAALESLKKTAIETNTTSPLEK